MTSSVRSMRSRKQQTRLQFQPLSSSSPAKQDYNEAIQDRLANVRFDGSRRAQRLAAKNKSIKVPSPLPSPQLTSPSHAHAQKSFPSSPLSSLRTSPTLPPRFTDILHNDSSEEDDIVVPSSKRRRLCPSNGDIGTQSSKTLGMEHDLGSTPRSRSSSSELDNLDLATPSRRSTRLINKKATPIRSGPSSSSQHLVSLNVYTPSKQVSDLGSAESTDSEEVMVTKPSGARRTAKRTPKRDEVFVVPDDEDVDKEFEDQEGTRMTATPPPDRTSEKSNTKRLRRRSKREREEIEEDLLDLQDSDQDRVPQKKRTRGGPVTTQRDKIRQHFEKLKRRRAGEKVPRTSDFDSERNPYDDDDEGFDIDEIGQEMNDFEVISDDTRSQLSHDLPLEEEVNMDEEDFVVEDQASTGRLGRPSTDIPLQFTSFASAKPRELFPHIIEWMVKNKISPAFNRKDEIYELSFARIDDQVKAQAGSRLISSAWNATFKHTILARPGIHVTALPGMDEELIRTCDACNKSNHPARYDFTFSDKAYSKETLEPIDDSDSDPDSDANDTSAAGSNGISCDEQGHTLASTNTHFYLGRFCAANAEMGHKLTHWKHHLNEHVLSYLEEQGVLSAEAIVTRERLNKKKREKEAEAIVDTMEETGMIKELWQGFQDDLEDARIGMEGHERRGGRSKARIGSVRTQRNNGRIGEWTDGGKFRQLPIQLGSDSEGE